MVKRFSKNEKSSAGVGFSYAIDKIRELLIDDQLKESSKEKTLLAFNKNKSIENALIKQRELHSRGQIAILELGECKDKSEALNILDKKKLNKLEWID